MPSFNQVMQLWHAYVREEGTGLRINLGYYNTHADACEAQGLGHKTDKVVTGVNLRTKRSGARLAAGYMARAGDGAQMRLPLRTSADGGQAGA